MIFSDTGDNASLPALYVLSPYILANKTAYDLYSATANDTVLA